MKQQREARNLLIIFLLMVASIHPALSLSQDLYTFASTIDISTIGSDQRNWSQPSNITTSVYQDTTTYLPSTNAQSEETLNSSETNVLNQYAGPLYHHEDSAEDDSDDSEETPNHAIPYSEHEEAKDVSTRPKYVAPGVWAKPPPEKDIPLDFVPTKLHAQVRGTHTVKRLPQQEAVESAESDEERRNAPRLREVVTNSKVNTVYTEEGYEDSAYDHAGHIRDADFHEGFARKLHDRKDDIEHDSSSDKGTTGEHTNLVPAEFNEYEDDYQAHLEESRKAADEEDNLIGYDRNFWEGTEIDPKLVAEDGAQKLEKDVEREAAETERNSKNYQKAQELKLRDDTTDSLEESNQGKDDLKNEESVKTKKKKKKKKKKSRLQNNKTDIADKGSKPSRGSERKKKNRKNIVTTTAIPSEETSVADEPEVSSNSQGFATDPTSTRLYSIDQTTLRYVAPIATSSFQQIDDPTTVSYSQLFWDYFKVQQGPIMPSTTESSALVANSTILNRQLDEQSPIAVATIDGRGPFLLTKQESTTSPFFNFYPQQSLPIKFGSAQLHLLGQNDNESGYVGNMIAATSTVATFTSMPLSLQSSSPSSSEEAGRSTTVLDESTFSSSPTVMTLNITQEAYSRIADYYDNPFLRPILDNSNIAVARNKIKYKVLVRPTKKMVKSVTPQPTHQQASSSSSPQKSGEKKKLRNELNAKYFKMLDYIKSKANIQNKPFSERKKLVSPEELTLMRPPVPQQIVYPIFSNHPSIANHSSVTVESESPREEINWRSSLQDWHRFQQTKLPYRFDYFPIIQPRQLTYRKDPFPATKLLPPSPQSSFANIYIDYDNNRQNNHRFSYGKQQQRDDRYFPLVPEASWRRHLRKKRSEPDTTISASFARSRDSQSRTLRTLTSKSRAAANDESKNAENVKESVINRPKLAKEKSMSIASAQQNGQMNLTNAGQLKKRNVSRNEMQSEVNLRSRIKGGDHEELLNEPSKISGDVIDKEIAARFNEKDNNETSAKIKEDEKVEVDVPSFDYMEEVFEIDEPSTTTDSASVDSKKYPFYNNEDLPSASALKYIVDPRTIPRKTARGMEFYESRNAYKQCDEVEPDLDEVLPEKEEPDPDRGGLQEDLPRLRGLGEKLNCFKAKYFDENPLDNPLFAEKSVEEPTPPSELDPTKFAARILVLPEESDDYVVQQVSKKPERHGRQWRNRNRPYETHESIRVNYKHDPQTGRGRNAYFHTVRGTRPSKVARRKTNNRKSRPRVFSTTTTQSPKQYPTASYQNQVYEDVMGNIRNMVNTYQVHEMTTLPSTTQILATASSKTALKIANITSSSSKERNASLSDVTDITSSPKPLMIKGLLPPPKYSIPRQTAGYRKHRPPGKNRASLLRSSNLPRIIAHHHTIKINKRSVTKDTAKNSSESAIKEDEKSVTEVSTQIAVVENDTLSESTKGTAREANATSDLEIEESRRISTQDRSLSMILKIDDRKRRNSSNSHQKNEAPQKIVYTIRDRIRYSKPKWDARGFGKFSTSPKTVDEDNRRKEPRYNHFKRPKRPTDNERNNSATLNSTENTWRIESAVSSIKARESGTTEVYRPEESIMHQMIYDRTDKPDPEPDNAENLENTESEENNEEKMESTTNMSYQVHENIEENVSTTTTRSTNPPTISREILNLQKYLESDPPGYAETFLEETTTPSSEYTANMNLGSEEREKKQQEEENNYPKNIANPGTVVEWDSDSSEKAEEQIETPMESFMQDDDSEELSSKEEEGSNKQQTFFTYTKRPTSAESDDKDDEEGSEKETFYHPYPFSKYKSKFKKESEEDESQEEDEEKSEDYVFPWHADKGNKRKRLRDSDRYEYPWERRERLAKERREKRKRANRFKKLIFEDEDEEESTKRERPVYPWERYDVPLKTRAGSRRGISRRYANDNEESSSEQPSMKFSSKYNSGDVKSSSPRSSKAREISKSIKKILEEDESGEEASKKFADRSSSFPQRSLPDRGISRGTLVPENITQPPRRKSGRAPRIDKDASSKPRFNTKKSRDRETDEAEEDGRSAIEYSKLNENNFDKDNPESETTNQPNRLSNSTTEVSSRAGQRVKRRRKIAKNNSTISVDSSPVESVTEPTKKRRRKPQTSTAASTIDLEASKSVLIPVRRKYSETDGIVRTRNADSDENSEADYVAEISTPKTGTIERRSRIKKEKIVRKTVYPHEGGESNSAKANATREELVRSIPIRSRYRENYNKRNNKDDDKKRLMRDENQEENHDKFSSEDEVKRSAMLGESRVQSEDDLPLKSFETKRKKVKKINDVGVRDTVINDENDNNDDFGTLSEIYVISNRLHNALSNRIRNDRTDGRNENERSRAKENWKKQNVREEVDEEETDQNAEETRGSSLLETKYIKDPERRLYYYVD